VTVETDEQRRKREQQRALFDGSAELYDATRQSYPAGIVDAVFATAAVRPGAAVLEVGCGTGQLSTAACLPAASSAPALRYLTGVALEASITAAASGAWRPAKAGRPP
jgi:cyclopropane fatty-acyl-phospholipid synthase-like methyltransferase